MIPRWPPSGRSVIVGVAGGSGSGKTTVAQAIIDALNPDQVGWLAHDAYYKDLADRPFEERIKVNFDHPDSLETELLIKHLSALRSGEPVEIPVYDFAEHLRTAAVSVLEPKPVVVLEGILVLSDRLLREQMDLKIFVDTESDVRLMRRLRRDVADRGRTVETVLDQWETMVRPMHLQFVEPSKRYADLILPDGYSEAGVGTVVRMIRDVASG
ncbi:MAG: uridine kinase [Acidimicrobiia bacterium]|nr:uridine kinase [Acidimicrobiia bacterium]NNC42049.1 uridine kinase [Acidimicrobiia bacterium]NND13374.1 uridine kinase [Acidimicrobiia bacterium]NNL27882.1 uridine kinase [Acidimicrobiia bacterium]